MKIDLTKTNGSSPPAGEIVRNLWQTHFPTIELTNTLWFEKYNSPLLDQGFRITAEKIKSGRFKAIDEKNIGKYALRVIQNLKRGHSARKRGKGWAIGCSVWIQAVYQIAPKDKNRFNRRLVPSGECLLFEGAKTTGGYGKFSIKGRSINAHFFAFFSEIGYLPVPNALGGVNGLQVAHSCGNRSCCNVSHLSLTTKGVNLAERNRHSVVGPLSDTVCDDYGSKNGSDLRRCSSGNSDVSQGLPCNDPLADPSVAQRGINSELNDIPSSFMHTSPQSNTEYLRVKLTSSQPSEVPQGGTGSEEIEI